MRPINSFYFGKLMELRDRLNTLESLHVEQKLSIRKQMRYSVLKASMKQRLNYLAKYRRMW